MTFLRALLDWKIFSHVNATFIFQNELNSKFSGVEQPAIWNKQTLIFLKNMHIFKRRLKFPNEIWTLSVWYLENMYGQCNINDQYCMVASNDGAINSLHSKVMTLMYLLWVLLYGLSWLHVCNVLLLELKYFSHFCFYRISWTRNQNVLPLVYCMRNSLDLKNVSTLKFLYQIKFLMDLWINPVCLNLPHSE